MEVCHRHLCLFFPTLQPRFNLARGGEEEVEEEEEEEEEDKAREGEGG